MVGKTVLVLGGGWGGLAVAHNLRGLLPPEHRVLVVERKKAFSLCVSYLWLMTGERNYPGDVEREMSKLANKGVEWVQAELQGIEPETRTVHTSSGDLRGDYLVIALGAESFPDAVPGFTESAHNLYDVRGVLDIRRAVSEFDSGRVVILISRMPYRCPAAPYEAAFLLEALFRGKGVRERVEISVYTPEKQPMPVGGPAVGDALRGMLSERGIRYYPEHIVSRVDGASRRLVFGGEEVPYDLLVGVPAHRAPQVVVQAGLTDTTGYIPTHPQTLRVLSNPDTLETRYPGVFAIGDIAAIRLLNQMFLPKAGVFAEGEARVVAQNIAAEIRAETGSAAFDGKGVCYVEVGGGMAAYGSGNFYAYPRPNMVLEAPSPRYRREKEELEQVLVSWFAPQR